MLAGNSVNGNLFLESNIVCKPSNGLMKKIFQAFAKGRIQIVVMKLPETLNCTEQF